jgi:hypothetical protein
MISLKSLAGIAFVPRSIMGYMAHIRGGAVAPPPPPPHSEIQLKLCRPPYSTFIAI